VRDRTFPRPASGRFARCTPASRRRRSGTSRPDGLWRSQGFNRPAVGNRLRRGVGVGQLKTWLRRPGHPVSWWVHLTVPFAPRRSGSAWLLVGHVLRYLVYLGDSVPRLIDSATDGNWST